MTYTSNNMVLKKSNNKTNKMKNMRPSCPKTSIYKQSKNTISKSRNFDKNNYRSFECFKYDIKNNINDNDKLNMVLAHIFYIKS